MKIGNVIKENIRTAMIVIIPNLEIKDNLRTNIISTLGCVHLQQTYYLIIDIVSKQLSNGRYDFR